MKNFQELAEWVREGRNSKACDSSERRHIFEFLSDVVDNIRYDLRSKNYQQGVAAAVLQQQLIGSLEELGRHVKTMLGELGESSEIGPEIHVERMKDERVVRNMREVQLVPVGSKGRASWKWEGGVRRELDYVGVKA